MAILDGLHKVVSRVIDAGDELGVSLCVGGPLDDDLVESIVGLELATNCQEIVSTKVDLLTGCRP